MGTSVSFSEKNSLLCDGLLHIRHRVTMKLGEEGRACASEWIEDRRETVIDSVMKDGFCAECGAKEEDGLSCAEQFGILLSWEQDNPGLYALHFWTVSCYMLQHPSHFTEDGYALTRKLFCDAYDLNWETSYILKKNREATTNKTFKITNPVPAAERVRTLTKWDMTVSDVYHAGKDDAIEHVLRWKKAVRDQFG